MTQNATISMKIEIRRAPNALAQKLTPLICLFSQMMFVGSVAALKEGT